MAGRSPRFYYAVAAVSLAVSLWAFRAQVNLARLPDDGGLRGIAFPAQIEGVTAGTFEELRFLAEAHSPGHGVVIVPAAASPIRVTLSRAHSTTALAVTVFSGLCFLAVSGFVFAPRTRTPAGPTFFWATLIYGVSILVGGVFFPRSSVAEAMISGTLQVASLAVLPVVFLHLSLSFPRRLAVLDRHRLLMPLLSGLAFLLIVWQMVTYHRYFVHPAPMTGRALAHAGLAADVAMVALCGAACITLFRSSRRLDLTRERAQVKWLLWGMVIGLTPYVFLRTLPQLIGLTPPFGPEVDRLFELAIPSAFVFAVVRYQFFDIDIVIRRSVIYGVLAGALMALYLGFGLIVKSRVGGAADRREWVAIVAVGLLAGILFNPARRAIGAWVDRTLFKIRHDHDRVLTTLRAELDDTVDERSMATVLDRCIRESLHPTRRAVVLRGQGRTTCAGDLDAERAERFIESIPGASGTAATPSSTSLPEVEQDDFPDDDDLVLMQATGHGSGSVFILLGKRSTGRRYVEEDVHLLREAADLTAIALERLHLIQAVGEERRLSQQMEELQRLKSDFLSRVAHDLRTPLASITWSSDNLLDGLAGPVNEKQTEYLRSIKTSADRLKHMVGNLLEISRLERGVVELEVEDVRLQDMLDDAVEAVGFLAGERGITIERNYDQSIPIGRGNEQKLYEVAINLLENAVRYAPPDSVVEVSADGSEANVCQFAVRDHGPGLGDVSSEELFRPFHQGTASPHAQQHGFGLGLHIVRSYMELMNGRITASTHPEGGAIFTCRLPVATETTRGAT